MDFQGGMIVLIVFVSLFAIWLLFYFIPVGLWFSALVSGVRISLLQLVLMRWRKVPPSTIVSSMIESTKAGLTLNPNELEAHYLAGGNVTNVVHALVSAQKANIMLDFKMATAIDLAGRDVFEAVQMSVNPKVINTPPVAAVAKAIRRSRVGLKDPKRPIGSFLFLGPTGVGKTELCKTLAEAMFGDENAMIRIDMSEYMEKHTVSRLVGSPPGYVGHEEGGQLTEKVRRKPYSVVLFDEIEKAHPDVWNILLQILEDGIVTDSQGRRVDFKNTIIVMTSNVGAKNITAADTPLGFDGSGEAAKRTEEERFARIKDAVMAELRQTFRPEFLNRIDEIIVFHQLTEENIRSIARRMLDTIGSRMAAQGITLQADDDAVAALAKDGFDARYGARPLRRTLQNEVEDVVAEQMLDGQLKSGDTAHVRLKDDKVVIEK